MCGSMLQAWCGSENSSQRAIALVGAGLVDVQGLLTHELALTETAEASG
jgi:hypothetical protein